MTAEGFRIQELEALVLELTKEISELKAELSRLGSPKKDSSNSSIPPSQDPFRVKRTESLRETGNRKPGGQPGHQGSILQMSENPTAIVDHHPSYCPACGRDLSDIVAHLQGRRQVIDIPPILPVITEHRVYSKVCTCGHCHQSDYPQGVHSAVCYGSTLQAMSAYFHARQYLSYQRMREMFRDIFRIEASEGTLVNLVHGFATKAGGIYEEIKQRIFRSAVAGADETGVCVAGKNHWAWTFQTEKHTYIAVEQSRGKAAIDRIFENGLPHSTLVHDCWKPYFNTAVQAHQICTAHLLRELNYLDKVYPDSWAQSFKILLDDALRLKRELSAADYLQPNEKRNLLEQRLDELLGRNIDPQYKELATFKNRMNKYREHLFLFLYQQNVPPDNNGSERAVRTFKVKQKVSGLFRNIAGAQSFAVIRSVVDTTIKNSQNVFSALTCIAKAE